MALPPLSAAAPVTEAAAMPPPGDEAMGEGAGQPEVFATVMRLPDGKFLLVDGDEPEPDEMGAGEPGMMDQAGVDGPALLKQLMAKIEGGGGAEESFAAGFKGEPAPTPAKPAGPAMKPMAA